MVTWLSDPQTVEALRRLAEKLHERIASAPTRAQAILYRSPYQASQRLREARSLRPLWLAATRLLSAHEAQAVPALLGRVKTRQHLAMLLAGVSGGAVTAEAKQVLAGAGIRAEDAAQAAEQLATLLPAPDAPEECRFLLWLERAEVQLGYHPEAGETPPEALDRLLEAAQVQAGQTVINPAAGVGYVAERLAEQYPDVPVTLVEAHLRLRPALQRLVALYPTLTLAEETEIAHLTGHYDRIVLRVAERWQVERADVARVRQSYERLLRPGGRLAALLDAPSGEDAALRRLQAWVEAAGGRYERLEDPTFREALVLVTMDKPGAAVPHVEEGASREGGESQ